MRLRSFKVSLFNDINTEVGSHGGGKLKNHQNFQNVTVKIQLLKNFVRGVRLSGESKLKEYQEKVHGLGINYTL